MRIVQRRAELLDQRGQVLPGQHPVGLLHAAIRPAFGPSTYSIEMNAISSAPAWKSWIRTMFGWVSRWLPSGFAAQVIERDRVSAATSGGRNFSATDSPKLFVLRQPDHAHAALPQLPDQRETCQPDFLARL